MWDDCPEMALEPVEPEIMGYCAKCGGEIYKGDSVFSSCDKMIHLDCAKDYILDEITVNTVMREFGYEERHYAT